MFKLHHNKIWNISKNRRFSKCFI